MGEKKGVLNGVFSLFFSAKLQSHVKETFDQLFSEELKNWTNLRKCINPHPKKERSNCKPFFPAHLTYYKSIFAGTYMALWYIAASLTLIAILLALASAFSLVFVVCFRHQNNRGTMICDYCKSLKELSRSQTFQSPVLQSLSFLNYKPGLLPSIAANVFTYFF